MDETVLTGSNCPESSPSLETSSSISTLDSSSKQCHPAPPTPEATYFVCLYATSVTTPRSIYSCNPTTNVSSQGQLVFGANVINYTAPISTPVFNSGYQSNCKKPFVLKFKTNQIRLCQSCRNNYEGPNDTVGLVVARAERRLVSNMTTGVQFMGKESNSHYHLYIFCLMPHSEQVNWLFPTMLRLVISPSKGVFGNQFPNF